MKLPRILLAIVVLVFAMALGSFAASASPTVRDTQAAKADKSVTVATAKVDADTVSPIECLARADWVRESVGRHVLNIKVRQFEPTKELDGHRQKVATKPKPKLDTYTGMGNTRAREQV